MKVFRIAAPALVLALMVGVVTASDRAESSSPARKSTRRSPVRSTR